MVIEIGSSASAAVLVINDQPLYLELSVIPVVDVDLVWPILVDLHLAATGSGPRRAGVWLSGDDAFDSWSRGTLGLEGYLRSISPEAAARVLGSASDFAEFTGSLEGIDSVYLTAMSSAGRDLNLAEAEIDRAASLIDQVGMPRLPGGGAAGTLITGAGSTGAGSNSAALANHSALWQQLDAANGNPFKQFDILARAGVDAGASGARSLIPGSGEYVALGNPAIALPTVDKVAFLHIPDLLLGVDVNPLTGQPIHPPEIAEAILAEAHRLGVDTQSTTVAELISRFTSNSG